MYLIPKNDCMSRTTYVFVIVWQHGGEREVLKKNFCSLTVFLLGEVVNIDKAICKLCNKKVMTRDGNTFNLRMHLRNNHPLTAARKHLAPGSLSATVSTPPADTDAGPTTTWSTASYTQLAIMGAPSGKQQNIKWTVYVGKPVLMQRQTTCQNKLMQWQVLSAPQRTESELK